MKNLLDKIVGAGFLSSWVVLGIDMLITIISSLCTLLVFEVLFPGNVKIADALWYLVVSVGFAVGAFRTFRTYKVIIRYSTLREVGRMVAAVVSKSIAALLLLLVVTRISFKMCASITFFDALLSIFLLISVRMVMIAVYDRIRNKPIKKEHRRKVLAYGASDKSASFVTRMRNSRKYQIVGFINRGSEGSKQHTLLEVPVHYFNNEEEFNHLADSVDFNAVMFTSIEDAKEEQDGLVVFCQNRNVRTLVVPPIDEMKDGKLRKAPVRDLAIEDLLGRDEIKISMDEIIANFKGKTIMVTGAAGSIGSELCRQLATFGIKDLVLYDNGETPMHNLRLELDDKFPDLVYHPIIGDVRMPLRLQYAFEKYRPAVVFHAAAYKHVPLMEENPCEAVLVNVYGTKNLADMCIKYGVEKMVMVSTDKAVNPTNIMGCTKRLAEIYVQSLGLALERGELQGKTRFVTTRFGNVLGSNGSVIPRFKEQIAKGGPITVTHPDITRFFMSIPEACRLVMEAATMTTGNQIFVFDMGKSVKIVTLAKRMIELCGLTEGVDIDIEYTGLRPGEKLYEEVLSNNENTLPTNHDRIRIAKVREYDYNEANKAVNELERLSRAVNIPDMVRYMKHVVPEFKSKNSRFEQYDKELEAENATEEKK